MMPIVGILSVVCAGAGAGFAAGVLFAILSGIKDKVLQNAPPNPQRVKYPAWKMPAETILKIHNSVLENPDAAGSRAAMLYASAAVSLIVLLAAGNIVFGLLSAGAAYYAARAYFSGKTKARAKLVQGQLIEALTALSSSVRSGQSLVQAIENTVKDMKPPISSELEIVLQKYRLGMPLDKALKGMSARMKSDDLRVSVTAMNLARESGGNMADLLSSISETMRERKKIHGKIDALTAQGKMSGAVMGIMPFLLLCVLYFIQPEIMGLLFTTLPGNIMFSAVVVMVAAGSALINRIINIDI